MMPTLSKLSEDIDSMHWRTYWACRVRELQVTMFHSLGARESASVVSAMGCGKVFHCPVGTISRMNRPASMPLRT